MFEHGPSPGAIYYVSEQGSDTQGGTFSAPFKTIAHGVYNWRRETPCSSWMVPITMLDGWRAMESMERNPSKTRSLPRWMWLGPRMPGFASLHPDGNDVRPLLEFDGSGGIEFKTGSQYVILEGLEIKGPNQEIQYEWAHEHRWTKELLQGPGSSRGPVDHIVVRDCHVHHTPGSDSLQRTIFWWKTTLWPTPPGGPVLRRAPL